MAEGGVAPATFYAESEYEVRSLKSLKEKIFLYFGPKVVSPTLLSRLLKFLVEKLEFWADNMLKYWSVFR